MTTIAYSELGNSNSVDGVDGVEDLGLVTSRVGDFISLLSEVELIALDGGIGDHLYFNAKKESSKR